LADSPTGLGILESILDAIFQVTIQDPQTSRVVWLNKSAMDNTPAVYKKTTDLTCFHLRFDRTSPCPNCPAMVTLKTGAPAQGQVFAKNGRAWNIQIFPVKSTYGDIVNIVEISLEVTKLQEWETRYHTLLEVSPDAVIITDLHGNVVDANHAAAKLHGHEDPSEIRGKPGLDYVVPRDREKLKERNAAILGGRSMPADEFTIERADGEKTFVSLSSALLKSPSGEPEGIIGVLRDITRQKQTEQALRREKNLVTKILDASPTGILVLSRGREVVYANSEVGQILDLNGPLQPGERISIPTWLARDPEGRELPEEALFFNLALTSGQPVYDVLYRTGAPGAEAGDIDNGEKYLSCNAVPLPMPFEGEDLVVLTMEDITHRVVAERNLKKLTQRLKILRTLDRGILAAGSLEQIAKEALDHLPLLVPADAFSVIIFDDELRQGRMIAHRTIKGRTLFLDDKWFSLEPFKGKGKAFSMIEGKDFLLVNDLESTKFPANNIEPLTSLREMGRKSALFVLITANNRPTGLLSFASFEKDAFTSEDTKVAREVADGMAVAIRQARLNAEVMQYTEHLEQKVQERTRELKTANNELETFAYSVSHDLRAPLRSMQGFAMALLEDYQDVLGEQGLDFTKRIIESAKGMDRLITDLLEYSRIGRKNIALKPIQLASAVRVAFRQLDSALKEAEVETRIPDHKVMAHSSTLVRIVSNLLTNAVKFTEPGKKPKIVIRSEIVGFRRDRVRLWVEDNGIGIEQKYLDKIFQVFERLHSSDDYPGTGIGLATVKRAVEKMNGRIGVESKLGKGSKFWVELESADTRIG